MDGFINSSIEKQTIYEIYRACRLCGAGAGYKMPIMQNVVHLDGAEVELRQKIRECVQIEVHQEDKMPPLICELCVDKVNDFYEFLEMCRQTNKRTRLRLGLPPQTMPRGAPDAGDCILGVTEPVYLNEDSNESLLKPKARNKGRFTKESQSAKKSNSNQKEVRSHRIKHSSPPPQRASKRVREDDMSLSKLQKKSARPSMTMPKSILRKESEVKKEDDWSPTRSKRSRDSRDAKPETVKKVKIMEKPSPKSDFKCKTCKAQFNSNKALNNHMRIHNRPQPKCRSTLKQEKKNTCSKCKKDFQTKLSLDRHKCAKANANKCQNCGRHISNPRNLANHERACLSKKEFKISPHLLKQLRPIQIRVRRCDPLLKRVGERYDISGVDYNFGLDNNCIYPYLTSLRIKTEPSYMVNIHDTIDEFDLNHDYVHWDSDSNDSDLEISDLREKSVGTLANLSLRTIFSHKFLGKVPKRKRYVKSDKAYNSVLNFDSDVRLGIDNIINSLDNDRGVNDTKDNDNDSLFGDNKTAVISNDDFDSLFCSNNDSENTLNDDKRKSDDGECELVNKNTDIDNKKSENINEINNDTLTKLVCNDTVKNTQENDKSESSKVVLDNDNTSDVNNDKVLSSAQDSITKEMKYKEDEEDLINNKTVNDSDVKENDEIILKNNDSISKIHTNYKESGNSINNKESSNSINKESEQIENVIENDDSVFRNENEKATVKINDNDRESNIPVNEKDLFINKPPNTELREVNDVENNDSSAHANDVENNDSSAHDNVKDKDSSAHDNVEDKDFSAHDNLEKNDSSAHINDVENNDSSAHNNDVENNDSSAHDNDFENNSSGHDNDNKTVTNNDNKLDKTAFHVNGDDKLDLDDLDDISDSEMDDSRLMDAIDEQLGEKEKKNKNQEDDRDSISDVKSADLESISSGELPNE